MTGFTKLPLTRQKTVGEQLRVAREAQHLSMQEIAQRIRVSAKYLEMLERGRYRDLPSLVYARNYTRLYAKELRLPWPQLEQVYEQEVSVYSTYPGNDPSARQQYKTKHQAGVYQQAPLIIPRLLKFGGVGVVVLLVAVYFVWELVQFLSPPTLVILSPEHDMIVSERDIDVVGETAPEALVEMNGQAISVEPDGHFSEQVYLKEGLNTLRISAHSKRSKERVEIRYVLYDPAAK
jgi:transcriptional regulator with XRE-family HTH domain